MDPMSSRTPTRTHNAAVPARGVQSRLDETTFAAYLDGFEPVAAEDLLEARGGRVRYAIDGGGGGGQTQYRLGGWLQSVDPQLRYLRLFNPYARRSWSVQLGGGGVRLWYMPPGTSDEVATMRRLLQQLDSGAVRITKVGG